MDFAPIKTPPAIRRFGVYDMEWVPGSLDVRVVCCRDHRNRWDFSTVAEFLDHALAPQYRGYWWYAHAGGLADVQFILREFIEKQDKRFTVECAFSGSSAIIVTVRRGNHAWHFIDSYWLLKAPLSEIGKSIGLHKTGPTDNMTKAEVKRWYAEVPLDELTEYCHTDCEILYEAIRGFQEEILQLGGQLQMTAASTAMRLFRRRFLEAPIRTNQSINAKARQGYIASRVEAFDRFMGRGRYYDFNSSFPWSMTGPLPGSPTAIDATLNESEPCYMVKCRVTTPQDIEIPPLPIRHGSRIFFPTGSWEAWLAPDDVQLLYDAGGSIDKVEEVIHFEARYEAKAYVDVLYGLRANSTGARKEILKILLNSFYGKTAESTEKERVWISPPKEFFDRDPDPNWCLMPSVWIEPQTVAIAHEHVPMAMTVTSRSRALLTRALWSVSKVYYCDTDGFATDDYCNDDPKTLGALKLEKIVEEGTFVAPKVYKLKCEGEKEIYKAKGFSLDKRYPSYKWEALASGGEVEIERMIRIRENLKGGGFIPAEALVNKKLGEDTIPKRFTYPDGSTRPWDISELESIQ